MAKLFPLARMSTATTGTGTITLGSAVTGYLTFAQAGVSDGDIVRYAIKDGSNSEIGIGTYTAAGTTLSRTVEKSTNSNAAINLSGVAEVFITPSNKDFFDQGTAMLFQQTSAPTGWTKQTTHNDKALRVVSGTAGSGGSSAFSTVFGKTATDAYTLALADMAAHAHALAPGGTHRVFDFDTSADHGTSGSNAAGLLNINGMATDSKGGGGSHSHGIDLRVQYVDLIIATKD
jgi:hypothetical protein